MPRLQPLNDLFQFSRDFLWIALLRKLDRRPDPDLNFSRRRKFSSGLLDLKQSIDPHRDYRNPQIVYEQANSGTEWPKPPIFSVASFWKHQHAVAAIDSFPGVGEALAEAGLPRERKQ